ncbi:hypothetical protein [Dysgonomonas sp. ZJ709]|uniref:hypothetical protein n=1 Tax=Dysgonomonas sp. ZJ709 TaxID=2709797 RepID=UPI0013E9A07A|nr:hypothetical protein [Dysgonomonas sp. ZJ709]
MKTIKFSSVIILFAAFFISCSDDNKDQVVIDEFAGYYKITAIESSIPIDMNNDGIKSNNVLMEISSRHAFNGEVISNFYNFNSFPSFAEVRPLPEQSNDARLIAFNYPYQILLNEDEGNPVLMYYMKQFINYSYNLKPNNEIEVIDNNPDYHSEYGVINSASRIDENSFQVNLSTKLYDFEDRIWVEADIEISYAKVSDIYID